MDIKKYEALKKVEKIVNSCNDSDQLNNCINWIYRLKFLSEDYELIRLMIQKKINMMLEKSN